MSNDLNQILTERGERYGKFVGHAAVSQHLKAVIRQNVILQNKTLEDDQTEALEMIAHKIARIINGDHNYADSWQDIAGYAQLVADRLMGTAR